MHSRNRNLHCSRLKQPVCLLVNGKKLIHVKALFLLLVSTNLLEICTFVEITRSSLFGGIGSFDVQFHRLQLAVQNRARLRQTALVLESFLVFMHLVLK